MRNRMTGSARVAALLLALFNAATLLAAPFDVEHKPAPRGDKWIELIPEQVGDFERVRLKTPDAGFDGQAEYRSRRYTTLMSFGLAKNERELGETFRTIERETRAPPGEKLQHDKTSLGRGVRYVYRATRGSAFFAWSRGLHYFSVESKGRELALQDFLRSFPY
jgi:hypothetical protein